MKRLALFIVVGCAVVAVQAWAETGTTAVLVTSDPSGAAVYLDGAMERAGETPVTLRLRRGEHRLQLGLAGRGVGQGANGYPACRPRRRRAQADASARGGCGGPDGPERSLAGDRADENDPPAGGV